MTKKVEKAIKKVWLKMLKAYAKGKMEKARKLELKVIALELELKNA
jgi:hypothetical protein